jgi:hypothetical protein
MEFVGRTVLHKPIIGEITYIHIQSSTSNTWVINHDLHRFPSVTVVDTSDNIVQGKVVYNSDKQLTITFFNAGSALAFQGKAYLN